MKKSLLSLTFTIVSACGMDNPDHQLIIAVKDNDLQKGQQLLHLGANLFFTELDEFTVIWQAAKNGSSDMIALLLGAGVNINSTVSVGTPLHISAHSGNIQAIRVLLSAGAHVDSYDKDYKQTPLHNAAEFNKPEAIKALLQAGANNNLKEAGNRTPLEVAIHMKKINTQDYTPIKSLLQQYDHLDQEVDTVPNKQLLNKVIQLGYSGLVQKLLPKLQLTVEELASYNQNLQSLYNQKQDPIYKTIAKELRNYILGKVGYAAKIRLIQQVTAQNTATPEEIAKIIASYAKAME